LFNDGTLEIFDEDCRFTLADLSTVSAHRDEDTPYTYNVADIDAISSELGIPLEISKDIPFSCKPTFISFLWDLDHLTVELPSSKREKYLAVIHTWLITTTHVLQQVQELHSKLLHSCLVIPSGRSHLTGLECMLSTGQGHPFVPRHAPKPVATNLA